MAAAGNLRASSVNRDSRTTVTLISPGYVNRSSNALAMSRQILAALASSVCLALAITRSSRPAWIANACSTPGNPLAIDSSSSIRLMYRSSDSRRAPGRDALQASAVATSIV